MSELTSAARSTVWTRRVLIALLALASLSFRAPALGASAQQPAVPGITQLADGLTLVTRSATASPTVSLEVWIRCPASGYGSPQPGLARLTALSLVETKTNGTSLRDDARRSGAQIAVSVYQESTEIAVSAPAYLSSAIIDRFNRDILHPHPDQAAFAMARQRLAAQQVASMEMVDQVLRDTLFAHMFLNGPLHDSSYGDPKTLTALTLNDVNGFASRAYVPSNEIVVAVGQVNTADINQRASAAAPSTTPPAPMPDSTLAAFNDNPLMITRDSVQSGGVAIGWVGPPISDERAATAMDFLSDYLTHEDDGIVTKAVHQVDANAEFVGQFVTLRNPGVLFVTASGSALGPTVLSATIRDAVSGALRGPLSKAEFDRARDAYVTHLLSDMQTSQGLADNYGWYFAQGALPYSPSATDVSLAGDYFAQVSSLTPDYLYSVARRYLLARPAIVYLSRTPVHLSGAQ